MATFWVVSNNELNTMRVDRRVNRLKTFGPLYPSANRMNFDSVAMPQPAELRGVYNGPVHLALVCKRIGLEELRADVAELGHALAGVMEAFHFGVVRAISVMGCQKAPDGTMAPIGYMAPGSIGQPKGRDDVFCPILVAMGRETVALGVECIGQRYKNGQGRLWLEEGSKILLVNK